MKKLLALILLVLVFGLSACQEETPYVVDCGKYPTHEDCIVEPTECVEGFVVEDGECVPDDTQEPTCQVDYIYDGETCVFDNASLGDYLDIYYINDFHGALDRDNDQIGIAYIANLINTRKEQSPENVMFLAGGDILQGSALSNYYNGLSTITLLNAAQLDAFTVGNHEFDWGIDTILQYTDGSDDNGEADFPFLGANIFQSSDDQIPTGIDPYTIIERGDHKIGIIGTMGYGLEYSIATSRITGYYFGDPVAEVAYYSEYLRTVENCNVIIVVAHDSGNLNNGVANLTGDQRVDAIFNGHSHQTYVDETNGVPIMQSGSTGEFVGHIRLFLQGDGTVYTHQATNMNRYTDALLNEADPTTMAILEGYHLETDAIFNDPIITSLNGYSSSELSHWLSRLIRISMDVDIAFQNYGGTRTNLDADEVITLSTLYAIWPFDNVIKTVELDGAVINNLLFSLAYDTDIDTFEAGTLYSVATNDYVFDKPENPFLTGTNPYNTGIILRDLVEVELVAQAEEFDGFETSNDIQTVPVQYEEEALQLIVPSYDETIHEYDLLSLDYGETGITEVIEITADDNPIAYVYTVSFQGFQDVIVYQIGINTTNEITGYAVLSQNDTPGYGAQIADLDNWQELLGRAIDGPDSADVDGLAGATVTTLAWEDSLSRVFEFHLNQMTPNLSNINSSMWLSNIKKEEADFLFF